MKVAEKHYYHDIVKYSNDMKKSWGIIKPYHKQEPETTNLKQIQNWGYSDYFR